MIRKGNNQTTLNSNLVHQNDAPDKVRVLKMEESQIFQHSHCGFPVHVKEYSKGKTDIPIVVIGGAFQNIDQIERMSKALARESWTIVLDTPGNGQTGVLPSSYPFEFIADCINASLEIMGVRKINLVGFSYGCLIALRYIQLFTPKVSRLVLLGAMHRIPQHLEYEFSLMIFYLKWGRQHSFADSFTNLMSNPELRQTNKLARLAGEKLHHALMTASVGLREQFMHNTQRILDHGNMSLKSLPDIRTLVSTGEHDIFVPPAANKVIANAMPRGNYVSIPGADHMIHVIQFKKTIQTILRGCSVQKETRPVPTFTFPPSRRPIQRASGSSISSPNKLVVSVSDLADKRYSR